MDRHVLYEEYLDKALYLRWTVIRVASQDYWTTWEELSRYEEDALLWCHTNAKGRYHSKNFNSYVSFENRQDAMLFKLAFG
ncbi:hypothetical protein D3C71_1885620 [compost metagenome]